MDAKLSADFNEKQDICMVLKYLPTDCLLCARETFKSSYREIGHHLELVMKINITNERQTSTECLQIRHHISYAAACQQRCISPVES